MGLDDGSTPHDYDFPGAGGADTRTLAANLTLTDTNGTIQFIDANGANRDVTLPAEATANHMFVIVNTSVATYNLVVKDDAGVTVATVGQNQIGQLFPNGIAWEGVVSGAAGSGRYAHEETTVTYTGVKTNQSIFTVQINANDLSSDRSLVWDIYGDRTDAGGASDSLILKFGATTLFATTLMNGATGDWHLRLKLVNTATNAQRCFLDALSRATAGVVMDTQYGTAAEDTTANKNLELLWTTNGGATLNKYFSEVRLFS
jgi:hypothetical protein